MGCSFCKAGALDACLHCVGECQPIVTIYPGKTVVATANGCGGTVEIWDEGKTQPSIPVFNPEHDSIVTKLDQLEFNLAMALAKSTDNGIEGVRSYVRGARGVVAELRKLVLK